MNNNNIYTNRAKAFIKAFRKPETDVIKKDRHTLDKIIDDIENKNIYIKYYNSIDKIES